MHMYFIADTKILNMHHSLRSTANVYSIGHNIQDRDFSSSVEEYKQFHSQNEIQLSSMASSLIPK